MPLADWFFGAGAVAALTFVAAWALSDLYRRQGRVAHPNARSSHAQSTPVGVGVVVPMAVAVGTLVFLKSMPMVLVAALFMALLGFVEDRREQPASIRLALQTLISLSAAVALGLPIWAILPSAVAIVATVNALNFMDGINGITATHGVLYGIILAVAAQGDPTWTGIGAMIVAGCLGYLPNNFPAARSFPGDVLPYFLGAVFVLGLLDLSQSAPVVLFGASALLPAAVDTSSTLLRRRSQGFSFVEPHRDHAYQQLAHRTSHTTSTLVFILLSALGSISFVLATADLFAGSLIALFLSGLLTIVVIASIWCTSTSPASHRGG